MCLVADLRNAARSCGTTPQPAPHLSIFLFLNIPVTAKVPSRSAGSDLCAGATTSAWCGSLAGQLEERAVGCAEHATGRAMITGVYGRVRRKQRKQMECCVKKCRWWIVPLQILKQGTMNLFKVGVNLIEIAPLWY